MSHRTTDFDLARDDLFSNIHRCGVLRATPEQQTEWMEETIEYLGERFPALTREELGELKMVGERFCQPIIPHGKGNTAQTAWDESEQPEETETTDETAVAGTA